MRTTAEQLIVEFGSGRLVSYHAIQEESLCCKEDMMYVQRNSDSHSHSSWRPCRTCGCV